MPLSESDRAELERLGVDNVRQRLVPGSGGGSVVPGLGPGFGMTRGDVEEWLAEKSLRKLLSYSAIFFGGQRPRTWIGVTNILVMIALTALSFIWPID